MGTLQAFVGHLALGAFHGLRSALCQLRRLCQLLGGLSQLLRQLCVALRHCLLGHGGIGGGLCLVLRGLFCQPRGFVAQELVQVLHCSAHVHADVLYASFILVEYVVEAKSAIYGQVLVEFVGGSQLQAEDVLLSVHVAFHGVSRRVGAQSQVYAVLLLVELVGLLHHGGQQGYLPFERA